MPAADTNSRVPFFTFEERESGIDVEKTEKEGYEVPRFVTYILITPHGQKAPFEFEAESFIARKRMEARRGDYSPEWCGAFERSYEEHKKGNTLPREGTPILLWERITKQRRQTLAKIVPTLEDLVAWPDSQLVELGPDARQLRETAKNELQAKKSLDPLVRENAVMKTDLEELRKRLGERDDIITQMAERLAALEDTPKRGRPPKTEEID